MTRTENEWKAKATNGKTETKGLKAPTKKRTETADFAGAEEEWNRNNKEKDINTRIKTKG